MSNQNNLSAREGNKQLDQDDNVQSTEDLDKSKGDKTNFADQNLSSYQDKGDRESKENVSEETIKDNTNSSEKNMDGASNSEQVNVEDSSHNTGASKNEGAVITV